MRRRALLASSLALTSALIAPPTRLLRAARPVRGAPTEEEEACATVDECETIEAAQLSSADVLRLRAEKLRLEAKKDELLLNKEKLARAKAKAEDEAAAAATPFTTTTAAPAAAPAARAAKNAAAGESAADCGTAEECATEAEALRLEAEKLRLEAQKAELLLQRERRAAEQLKEAEALADATLAFEEEEEDDDDDDLFGMEEAVARRYPELEARASEVATSEALLALFPEASLTMTAAVADELKDACFGLDGFYCSAVDSCAAGAIFRGNVRTKTAREALEVCVGRLGKKPALADDWKLFVMEDPVPPTDEEIDDRIREAQAKAQAGEATLLRDDEPDNELMLAARRPTVFVAVAKSTKPLNVGFLGGAAARLVGLAATLFSCSAFAVSSGALNDALYDKLAAGDAEALAVVTPVGVYVLALLVAHELGHAGAASVRGVKWSPPLFLPSLSTGGLGAANDLDDYPLTKSDLFDVAIAGPLAGFVASLAFLVVGGVFTGSLLDAGLGSTLPALPGAAVRASTVGSLALSASSPALAAVIGDGAAKGVPLHPLAVAGLAGVAVNALALLPLGRTDGGRCALAAYGRSLAAGATALGTVAAGLVGIAGPNDLLLFHLLYVFTLSRDLEVPCVDEISDVGGRRTFYAACLFVAVLCLLPSPLAAPAVPAALPGFPTL